MISSAGLDPTLPGDFPTSNTWNLFSPFQAVFWVCIWPAANHLITAVQKNNKYSWKQWVELANTVSSTSRNLCVSTLRTAEGSKMWHNHRFHRSDSPLWDQRSSPAEGWDSWWEYKHLVGDEKKKWRQSPPFIPINVLFAPHYSHRTHQGRWWRSSSPAPLRSRPSGSWWSRRYWSAHIATRAHHLSVKVHPEILK